MELEVTLVGPGPWGFRVSGGKDQGAPLSVCRLISTGKAAEADVRENDVITEINGQPTMNMNLNEASNHIRNASILTLSLIRGRYHSKSIPENTKLSLKLTSVPSVTNTLSRNEQSRQVDKEVLTDHDLSMPFGVKNPNRGENGDGSNVMSEDHIAEVQRELGELSSFYIKANSECNDLPDEKDHNDNIVISRTWSKSPPSNTAYEGSKSQDRQRPSAFSDPYTRHPQPYSKETSPTYRTIIIRNPLTKGHLLTCRPEKGDLESILSRQRSRSTSTLSPQFQPTKSPTRVPEYNDRLQYKNKSWQRKTYSSPQSTRDEASCYFSDGEVFKQNYTRQSFSHSPRRSRKSPLNSSKRQSNSVPSDTRRRNRRDELPQSTLISVNNNQYYSEAEDQPRTSPSNIAVSKYSQYYSDNEGSKTVPGIHSNRYFDDPKQSPIHYVFDEGKYFTDSEESSRRFIRRTRPHSSSLYYSDTEGLSDRHGNQYSSCSTKYKYSDTEGSSPGYTALNMTGNEYKSHRNTNYYSDTEGYQTRNKRIPINKTYLGNTDVPPVHATGKGEVIRKPQFRPRKKDLKMPKYYGKIDAIIGEDASIAMSDTEAMSPQYSRRRHRPQYNRGNTAWLDVHQSNKHFNDVLTPAWKEASSLTRNSNEQSAQSFSSRPLTRESNVKHKSDLTILQTNSPGEAPQYYYTDMDPTQTDVYRSNEINSEIGHTDDFYNLSAVEKSSATEGRPWSNVVNADRTESAKNEENDDTNRRSVELFQKYFGSIDTHGKQNAVLSTRHAPVSYQGPWIHKSKLQSPKPSTKSTYSDVRTEDSERISTPLKPRSGIDTNSPVYSAVQPHSYTLNAKSREESPGLVEEHGEMNYNHYHDTMLQSPTFLRLNRILEVDEDK